MSIHIVYYLLEITAGRIILKANKFETLGKMHRVHSPFVYQEQSVCEIIVNNRKTAHSYFEDCQAQQITLCV